MKAASNIYEAPALVMQEKRLNQDPYAEPIAAATIVETYTGIKIELEIPETAHGNCKIRIDEGVLTVAAQGVIDLELNLTHIANKKLDHGRFYRGVLPVEWFGNEKLHLTCKNRLLTIHIPKRELQQKIVSEIFID